MAIEIVHLVLPAHDPDGPLSSLASGQVQCVRDQERSLGANAVCLEARLKSIAQSCRYSHSQALSIQHVCLL